MKNFTFFLRLIFFGLVMLFCSGWVKGQVTLPHFDPFNYNVSLALQTQAGWTSLNTGDDLLISSGSLSYFGLPSSTGNKVSFDGAGIDAAKLFTQQTSGTVYFSFLLNVTNLGSLNTTGSYFTGFTEGATNNFGATVWTRRDGAGYDIGINPRTTAENTVWSTGTTSLNNTLFIVISYQIVSGNTNDVVKLWINPSPGSSEPSATLSATNTGTDLTNINRILIRQDASTTTPFIEMDELRIGTTWASVTGETNWTGTSNTDWATIGNWTSGVPSSSYNVTIPTGNNVTISSSTSANCNNLTLEGNATLTIVSDASNSGSLIISGSYTGSGTFTYKRYMPDANWHMLGSPLSGQTISNFLTNASNSIVESSGNYSMKHYVESPEDWSSLYTSGTSGNLVLGQGYATKRSASGTVDLTGTPNNATVEVTLTKGASGYGWNLLSNPFTSAINTNSTAHTTNNLITANTAVLHDSYEALYIWDGAEEAYKIINHASGSPTASLVQNYLQVGQGFFVKSVDPASATKFQITTAMQSHQTDVAFKSSHESIWAEITINAETSSAKASTQISYKEGMNRGLDIGYDAGIMKANPKFSIYSRLIEDNGIDFGIQCLPTDYENLVVPIGLDAKAGDIVKFTAQSFNLPEEYNVFLDDRVLGIYTNLSVVDASYSIQLNNDVKGTGRFFVRTSTESALGIANLDNENLFKVFTRPNHNQIVIHGEAIANTIARVYTISGKQLISFNLNQSSENLVHFNEDAGVYIVKISNEKGTTTQKFAWIK